MPHTDRQPSRRPVVAWQALGRPHDRMGAPIKNTATSSAARPAAILSSRDDHQQHRREHDQALAFDTASMCTPGWFGCCRGQSGILVSGVAGAPDSGRVAPYPDPTSPGAHRHRLNRAIVRPIDTNTPLDTAAAPVTVHRGRGSLRGQRASGVSRGRYLRPRGDDRAAEQVAAGVDAEAKEGRGRVGLHAELLDVFDGDGLHHDDVAVTPVPRWRCRTQEVGGAYVIAELKGSGGQVLAGVIARPAGSSVTEAGISATAQCQKPEPLGASGSYTTPRGGPPRPPTPPGRSTCHSPLAR